MSRALLLVTGMGLHVNPSNSLVLLGRWFIFQEFGQGIGYWSECSDTSISEVYHPY